jgi:hypothetical protein
MGGEVDRLRPVIDGEPQRAAPSQPQIGGQVESVKPRFARHATQRIVQQARTRPAGEIVRAPGAQPDRMSGVCRGFDVRAAGFDARQVIGIGVDTTGSSPIPVDASNRALGLLPKWKKNPRIQKRTLSRGVKALLCPEGSKNSLYGPLVK